MSTRYAELRAEIAWLRERAELKRAQFIKYRAFVMRKRAELQAENAYLKAILAEKDNNP